jgi:hypothetical protein
MAGAGNLVKVCAYLNRLAYLAADGFFLGPLFSGQFWLHASLENSASGTWKPNGKM